jgi:hypothetical protein
MAAAAAALSWVGGGEGGGGRIWPEEWQGSAAANEQRKRIRDEKISLLFPSVPKIRTFGLQIGTAQQPHLTRGFGPIVSKLSQILDHRHDDKASARRGPGWPTETSLAVEGAQEEDRGGRRWREEGYGGRQSRDPTKPGPSQKKRKFPRSHV